MVYQAGAFDGVVLGGAVERRVLACVSRIQFYPTVHKQFDNAVAAVPAGPMKKAETVVVTWLI